jgi:hypothetical protein
VLCNNNITDKGAKSISKYIELNTHIKRIDLSINNIEQKGGFAIYNALKNNKSLSHINLEHNHIDNKLIKKIDSILILKNSMRIEKGWKCN